MSKLATKCQIKASAILLGLSLLAGCGREQVPTVPPLLAQAAPAPAAAQPRPFADWLGKWQGPEGTALTLSANGQGYELVIENLDGPLRFEARAVGNHLQFERNGISEVIAASNGQATGMKWLADKTNCLTIRPGEGYCRN